MLVAFALLTGSTGLFALIGLVLCPGPTYFFDLTIELPRGTTANSPLVAAALDEIRRPEVLTDALAADNLGLATDIAGFNRRLLVGVDQPDGRICPSRLYICYEDKDAGRSYAGAAAITQKMRSLLTNAGQAHSWDRMQSRWRWAVLLENRDKPWFVLGGGVTGLAIACTGYGLRQFRAARAGVVIAVRAPVNAS